SGLIVVALGIFGYLIWRQVSASNTYNNISDASGIDSEAISDPNFSLDTTPIDVNWTALQRINPDIIAWIFVPGTRLSYPIVQGQDNEFYLTHTADGAANSSGAIFLDYQNSADFSDLSTFVYGHNMLGKTMFSEITNYVDAQFLADHPRIIILTPQKNYELTVIGAIRCLGTDPVRRVSFNDAQDFAGFLQVLNGYLVSGNSTKLLQATNVYCFSTCELYNVNARIIVIATDLQRPADTGNGSSN
ncbi:MAG: class B sortase, partial [Actinomycetia bacterium]|nr:class B sortase [Actinomycetes bacterium]